jgi:hypothetical protein
MPVFNSSIIPLAAFSALRLLSILLCLIIGGIFSMYVEEVANCCHCIESKLEHLGHINFH